MNQAFFHRLLHLLNEEPQRGKRLVGPGVDALWELWQRVAEAQKEFNRQVSQTHVYVEHVIRVIKIFRIAKEKFRMRAWMYETVVGCVCGLVRLRVQYA